MKWILVATFLWESGVKGELRLPVDSPMECTTVAAVWIEHASVRGDELVSYSCTMMEAQ